MNSRTLWSALIVLVAVNLLLFGRLLISSRQAGRIEPDLTGYIGRPSLPEIDLIAEDGSTVSLPSLVRGGPPTCLIFFSSSDCPTCFDDRRLWTDIPERTGARVFGVACSSDVAEFRRWEAQTGFGVEVYLDTTFRVLDTMNFRLTPLKVLFDRSGRPVWVDPPRITPEEQNHFWEDLTYALDKSH